jgi:hypothetical protein
MKPVVLAILCVGWILPSSLSSSKCFCIVPEMGEAFDYANAVFLGEVVDIVEPKTTNEKAPASERFYTVRFKVKKSWKGVGDGSSTFEVLTTQGLGYEAYPAVKKGELHLVYADPSQQKGFSAISNCGRSTVVRLGFGSNHFSATESDPFQEMKQLDVITRRGE